MNTINIHLINSCIEQMSKIDKIVAMTAGSENKGDQYFALEMGRKKNQFVYDILAELVNAKVDFVEYKDLYGKIFKRLERESFLPAEEKQNETVKEVLMRVEEVL